VLEQAAVLLVDGFVEPRGWSTVELAREEVSTVLREGFARVALEGSTVLGWVGGLPEYAGRVWELHPMVVRREYRRRGIGRALATAFEAEAITRGGLTATLGTDDDSGMTSLADVDLYENIPKQITPRLQVIRSLPSRSLRFCSGRRT
jgi:aminoglycoside 6'-N-acetyltransferase I